MTQNYDPHSCSPLQRPFYSPVEAAIRWCNLASREGEILGQLGASHIPKTGQFPQWPCLQANTEKILDAIEHGDIPHGRDGKAVIPGDHVAVTKRTIRHSDLKAWMAKHHPDQKPKFLFDDIERTAHPAINADSFRALQADRDALKARIEKAEEWAKVTIAEKNEWIAERSELVARLGAAEPLATRERNTLLAIIAVLCNEAKLDHAKPAKTANLIADTAAKMGISIGESTIEGHLKKIPDALGTRMK